MSLLRCLKAGNVAKWKLFYLYFAKFRGNSVVRCVNWKYVTVLRHFEDDVEVTL
jgi:hypothetical protein